MIEYSTWYVREKGGWSLTLRTRKAEPSRYNRLLRWLVIKIAGHLLRRQGDPGIEVEFDSRRGSADGREGR